MSQTEAATRIREIAYEIRKLLRDAQDEDDREADEYTAQRDLERRMAFRC